MHVNDVQKITQDGQKMCDNGNYNIIFFSKIKTKIFVPKNVGVSYMEWVETTMYDVRSCSSFIFILVWTSVNEFCPLSKNETNKTLLKN